MHERALMQDLMSRIETVAREQGASRVLKVQVWLGALSHLTASHFREHFEQAARGTCAEQAAVEVELSEDIHHPSARGVVLKNIEVEDS